ncbi:MAG: hypothetical protein J7559_05595, partial [Cohnella sp.]|nr:hypothetical protein [Cohnella sp.]
TLLLKKLMTVLLALLLLIQTVPAYAALESEVEKTVYETLLRIKAEHYPMPDDVLDRMPGQYAAAAASFDLTRAERDHLIKTLPGYLLARPEYVAQDDEESINGDVEFIVKSYRFEQSVNDYAFTEDAPSEWARPAISRLLVSGSLSEEFARGFRKPITIGNLARLYFDNEDARVMYETVEVDDPSITADMPAYVKIAFATGLIDNASELDRTMTREEAAVRISKLMDPLSTIIDVKDFDKVDPSHFADVANSVTANIITLQNGYFDPAKPFTLEQALMSSERDFYKLRGILPASSYLYGRAHVVVGNNFVYLDFESDEDEQDYIDYYIKEVTQGIRLTGKNQTIDAGYAIIELQASDADVKYTFKNNVSNVDFHNFARGFVTYGKGVYSEGFIEGYKAEPRELKPGEKPNLSIQPDSTHKKLDPLLDKIVAKIIKPGMTEEQKARAIHDYVVTQIVYGGGASNTSATNALIAIEKGKGTCTYYSSLFYYLAKKASLTTVPIEGDSIAGRHAWNMVRLNGKWQFVDATFDDSKKKLNYDYSFKGVFAFMDSHGWSGYGYPNSNYYPQVDGMKIKSTEELRVYLLQQLNNDSGSPEVMKFKVIAKGVNTDIGFLRSVIGTRYKLSHDAKSGVYTVKAT